MTYMEAHRLIWQYVVDRIDAHRQLDVVKRDAVDVLYNLGLITNGQREELRINQCCALCVMYDCATCPLGGCNGDDSLYRRVWEWADREAAERIRDIELPCPRVEPAPVKRKRPRDENVTDHDENVTNYELARWLRASPDRELSFNSDSRCQVHQTYSYMSDKADSPVPDFVWVRQGKGDLWARPTRQYIREAEDDRERRLEQ